MKLAKKHAGNDVYLFILNQSWFGHLLWLEVVHLLTSDPVISKEATVGLCLRELPLIYTHTLLVDIHLKCFSIV